MKLDLFSNFYYLKLKLSLLFLWSSRNSSWYLQSIRIDWMLFPYPNFVFELTFELNFHYKMSLLFFVSYHQLRSVGFVDKNLIVLLIHYHTRLKTSIGSERKDVGTVYQRNGRNGSLRTPIQCDSSSTNPANMHSKMFNKKCGNSKKVVVFLVQDSLFCHWRRRLQIVTYFQVIIYIFGHTPTTHKHKHTLSCWDVPHSDLCQRYFRFFTPPFPSHKNNGNETVDKNNEKAKKRPSPTIKRGKFIFE